MNNRSFDDEIDIREYVDVFRRRWKVIAYVAAGLAAVALIFSFFQSPVYEAKTTILVNSGGGGLSGLASLASMVGGGMPAGDGIMGDLVAVLKSRAVADKVVKDLDLREKISGWDDPGIKDEKLASAVQQMLRRTKATGNLLEIVVEYSDPALAVEIADGYVNALSYYWNNLNRTEAQKKREYIEGQMPRVKNDLELTERRLKSFSLLGVADPSVEYKRIEREFEIQNTVYVMLRKEYETVKLEESKIIPPSSVVDGAVVPKTPVRPRPKLNALIGLVLGLCSGSFIAFFQEYWEETGKRT